MSKFFSFLKCNIIHIILFFAMVFATVVLATTSQNHGVLIAIFCSFTVIGFVMNRISYEGENIFMLLAFMLIAILCSLSFIGTFIIKRSVDWQNYTGLFMLVMNMTVMVDSFKLAGRIFHLRDREERGRLLGLDE